MIRTLKALSALLSYPTDELRRATEALREALSAERLLDRPARRALDPLLRELAAGDLIDLQERYVLLFDRTRALSLYLFEHVHGESRDRGQAMIDLAAQYEKGGLVVRAAELPDFLPLFLEYLATRPLAEACEMLGRTAHILAALAERLRERASPYEAVFRALGALAAHRPRAEDVAGVLAAPDPDPADLGALDAAWEDEPVSFGPGAGACKDGLIARIRAARRPARSGADA